MLKKNKNKIVNIVKIARLKKYFTYIVPAADSQPKILGSLR